MGALTNMPPFDRAKITLVPPVPCEHKTHIYQLVDPIPWLPTCNVYQSCILNELHSLAFRHLVNNGVPSRNLASELLACLLTLVNPTDVEPISRGEVVARKPDGPSRRRYARAKESLDRYGPCANWARVSAFIKVEKWEQPLIDNRKPPRLIQFRTYPYCMEISRYLIPIEAKLWGVTMNGLPVFAKGMSSFKLGALFRRAYELFDSPFIVMMDHSKFDASLSAELIEQVELGLYSLFSSEPVFRDAMKQQLRNKCATRNGVKYTCLGRKMSGEYNTSCGDSVVNLAIIMHSMRDRGIRYHPLVNGDDSAVICERDPELDAATFVPYGMKTVVETTTTFEHVDFCQSRPIQVRPDVWRLVRNPMRVMTRGVVSVKRYNGVGWAKLVNSMGLCELACNDGVPVLQEFALYLMRAGAKHTRAYLSSEISYRAKLEELREPTHVTDLARDSFANAFGISPTEQLSIEDSLRRHTSAVLPMSKLGWS